MTEKDKPVKVVFAPGAFDDFEGTQEELDELIAEVHKMFEGKTAEELKEQSREVDMDEMFEEDPELAEQLAQKLFEMENNDRKLN